MSEKYKQSSNEIIHVTSVHTLNFFIDCMHCMHTCVFVATLRIFNWLFSLPAQIINSKKRKGYVLEKNKVRTRKHDKILYDWFNSIKITVFVKPEKNFTSTKFDFFPLHHSSLLYILSSFLFQVREGQCDLYYI